MFTGKELIEALHRGRLVKPHRAKGGIKHNDPKATCALGAIAIGLGIKLNDNYDNARDLKIPTEAIWRINDDSSGDPDDAVIEYLQTI